MLNLLFQWLSVGQLICLRQEESSSRCESVTLMLATSGHSLREQSFESSRAHKSSQPLKEMLELATSSHDRSPCSTVCLKETIACIEWTMHSFSSHYCLASNVWSLARKTCSFPSAVLIALFRFPFIFHCNGHTACLDHLKLIKT